MPANRGRLSPPTADVNVAAPVPAVAGAVPVLLHRSVPSSARTSSTHSTTAMNKLRILGTSSGGICSAWRTLVVMNLSKYRSRSALICWILEVAARRNSGRVPAAAGGN